jgi:hypothetical protein
MMIQEFISRANAQGQSVEHIKDVITLLDSHQMDLHLSGKCICCQEMDTTVLGIWDVDYSDEDGPHGTCVGYAHQLFCDGCVDHLDADTLRRYGFISDATYNKLCNPTDDTTDDDDDLPF